MALRRCSLAFALLIAGFGCESARTEILVVTDSDMSVPGELDQLRVVVTAPDGESQESMATLGADQPPLPRRVGLVHSGGPLGVYEVLVEGRRGGAVEVARTARVSFLSGETVVLAMHLVRSCVGASCASGETCAEAGCRSVDVGAEELPAWSGSPPRLADVDGGAPDSTMPDADVPDAVADSTPGDTSVPDTGPGDTSVPDTGPGDTGPPDTCVPSAETCNGIDDDCDLSVDEDFDLTTDPLNCGSCGFACVFRNGAGICNGSACQVTSCDTGFDDCDSMGSTGCETDLTASSNDCGACGNRCTGGTRVCCASTCARDCL